MKTCLHVVLDAMAFIESAVHIDCRTYAAGHGRTVLCQTWSCSSKQVEPELTYSIFNCTWCIPAHALLKTWPDKTLVVDVAYACCTGET